MELDGIGRGRRMILDQALEGRRRPAVDRGWAGRRRHGGVE
jgi:hypothetical protein